MSLEFCTSDRKRTSLSRNASSARFWSLTSATHDNGGDDAAGRVAQGRDRNVDVERTTVATRVARLVRANRLAREHRRGQRA